MSNAATKLILKAAEQALKESPVVLDNRVKEVLSDGITAQLTPVVEHLTNNEPWYQSRVTWGALGAIVLPLLAFVGVTADIISLDEFVAGGMVLGSMASGALTLYGRWKAKRPLTK